MTAVQHIGRSEFDSIQRELFSLALPDFDRKPDSLSFPGKHFVAFLAVNASGIDSETLRKFSRWLLDQGCVYLCAWGPDCERMHDIFDGECLNVDPVIMTTWHSQDTLDEALWFFVYSAYPDDGYPCENGLAISLGNSDWDEQIRKRLSNLDAFNRDVVGDDWNDK